MSISVKAGIFWSRCVLVSWGVAYGIWYYSLLNGLEVGDFRTAAGIVAQLSGTMLGFILAALAILTTILGEPLIRNMQRTGHFKVLLGRMLSCVAAFGIATLEGTIIVFWPAPPEWFACLLIATTVFSVQLLIDVCRKFGQVLRNLQPA